MAGFRPLVVAAAALVAGPVGVAAPVPKGPVTTLDKLVGTWEYTGGTNGPRPAGSLVVELSPDGAMKVRQTDDGEAVEHVGTYKVDGDKVPYTLTRPDGSERGETLTLKKLTADELVVEDPDGIREEFRRVKPKADKDK